ncbi:MAG: type IV secretion system DNA-binding domain-containing protein [Sulfurisoma sp.]|nr:type IV secretion system DNA-binding domain-containing protein [Sulfurisoma sp.]
MNIKSIPGVQFFSPSAMLESASARALETYNLALARPENDDAPADLKDGRSAPFLANNGRSLARYIVGDDVTLGGTGPAWPTLAAILTLPVIAFLPVAMDGWAGAAASLPIILIAGAIMAGVFIRRRLALAGQAAGLLGEADWQGVGMSQREARAAQSKRASEDETAFVKLGVSAGRLAGSGDLFAADRGLDLGLSVNDLKTHLFVFGATGTGKTSGIARPMFNQIAATDSGIFVIDGKGDLPKEFATAKNYTLLSPTTCTLPLLGSLEPHEVAEALVVGGDGGDFWQMSAGSMIFHAAAILHAARARSIPSVRWTLKLLIAVISSPGGDSTSSRAQLQRAILDDKAEIGALAESFKWFARFSKMPDKMAGSIQSTALMQIEPVMQHPALYPWADAETGADPRDVLKGARMGLDVPEYRFGRAGQIVSQLVRAQVYKAAKLRGSKWPEGHRQVAVLIDEAALAIPSLTSPSSEAAILPIARSLGLAFVCMSQNIEQFSAKFEASGAAAFLDQFRSLVAFNSSPETINYLRRRAGLALVVKQEGGTVINLVGEVRKESLGGQWIDQFTLIPRGVAGAAMGAVGVSREPSISVIEAAPAVPEDLVLHDGEALMLLNRAGAPRRDVAKVERIF